MKSMEHLEFGYCAEWRRGRVFGGGGFCAVPQGAVFFIEIGDPRGSRSLTQRQRKEESRSSRGKNTREAR